MEFATFCAAFIEMPCQIIRGARRLIYRLLSWNPWQGMFLRLVERCRAAGCAERSDHLKSGSGCPDPYGPSSVERGSAMVRDVRGGETGVETSGP